MAGRIMTVKICSETIGNLSRDLPACSAVHQPAAPPREAEGHVINGYKLHAHNFPNSFFVPPCRTSHLEVF